MSNNEWMNRTAPQEHTNEFALEYSKAQWFNGLDNTDGPMGIGGIELPLKYFNGINIQAQVFDIPHRRGTVMDPAYLLQVARLAVITSKTSYYKDQGQIRTWSDTPDFENGYKSNVQYFCYIHEVEAVEKLTPVILTVRSTVAQRFEKVLGKFRRQVLNTSDRITGIKAPHYFYWLAIGSNGRVFFSDASNPYTIAPPLPYWDEGIAVLKPDADLQALAIPDYLYDHIVSTGWDEAQGWRKNGNGGNNTPPPTPPQKPLMNEAQVVASSQDAAPLNSKDAEAAFYKMARDAIKSEKASADAINLYMKSVGEIGWSGALNALKQKIEAGAAG